MRVIRKPKDFLCGTFFLVVGLGAIVLARGYQIGTASRMGTGYFPALMGGALCVLAAVLMARSFFGRPEAGPAFVLRGPALVLVAALLYALLLRPFGLLASTLVLVVVAAFGSPDSRPIPTLLLALGLAAGCTLAFVYGLGQAIPILGTAFGDWAR